VSSLTRDVSNLSDDSNMPGQPTEDIDVEKITAINQLKNILSDSQKTADSLQKLLLKAYSPKPL